MDLIDRGYEFWYNLRFIERMFPYIRQELERKYNTFSKVRILKEDDHDLPETLNGKVCVITGGTRGIGIEVVKALLRKDCHVIVGSSTKSKAKIEKIYDSIRAKVPEEKGKLEFWYIDLKSMDSVVEFSDKFKASKFPLNYLIANAGTADPVINTTEDGFEEHFAINYLSHCLLIDRLIDNLYETSKVSNSESRIVLVSSCVHKAATIRFNDLMLEKSKHLHLFAYSQSKLAMVMFAIKMTRYLECKGGDWSKCITINSLHPGICNTQLFTNMPLMAELKPLAALAVRSAEEGAQTTLYAVMSKNLNENSGKYLEECTIQEPSLYALNIDHQNDLWDITWKLLDKWAQYKWT